VDKDGLKTPWKTVSSTPSWVAGKNKSETWRHMIASTSLIQFSLFFFLITKIWYPAIWHRSKFPPQEDNEVVFSVNLSSGVNVGNISYLMKLLRGKCDRLIANFRVSVPDRYAIQFLQKKLLFFSRWVSLSFSLRKSKISSWRLPFQSTKRKFVSNFNECYTQADRKVCRLITTK